MSTVMKETDTSSEIYTSNVLGEIFDEREPLTIETGKNLYKDQIVGKWQKALEMDSFLEWILLANYLNGCFVFNLNGHVYNDEIIALALVAYTRSKMAKDNV